MKKINIEINMYMKFRKYLPADASNDSAMISMDEGSTLQDLKNVLGIPPDEHGGAVINGTPYAEDGAPVLNDGDSVSFFATVAGG